MNPHHKKNLKLMLMNPRIIIAVSILAVASFAALFAPIIAPYPPDLAELSQRLAKPSWQHLLGCDIDGNDVFTSMLYGARVSLYIAFLTVILSVFLGLTIGLISGYYRGWVDSILMRLVEIVMAVPTLLVAMVLSALLGSSSHNIIFAIVATGWASSARLVRGQVLSVREKEFITACKALGAKDLRVIFLHVLPSVLSPLVVHATFSLSGIIIIEAGLSFLGLGAQDETPTWGALLGQGRTVLTEAPHLSIIPGLAIMLVVLALNFLGDGLRDVLDPKSNLS